MLACCAKIGLHAQLLAISDPPVELLVLNGIPVQ